jgi:hypothetical protein
MHGRLIHGHIAVAADDPAFDGIGDDHFARLGPHHGWDLRRDCLDDRGY